MKALAQRLVAGVAVVGIVGGVTVLAQPLAMAAPVAACECTEPEDCGTPEWQWWCDYDMACDLEPLPGVCKFIG